MPMWPFGRRGGKAAKLKEGRATAVAEREPPAVAHVHEVSDSDALRRAPSRRSSRRKRRSSRSTTSMHDVDKVSPTLPPVVSFSSAKETHSRSSAEDITALPPSRRLHQSPHLRPVTQEHGIPYNFQSHSSLPTARERGKLQRPQSLRRSVNESALVRRKSSKKREPDYVREEEIRAMSMPLPQKRRAGNSGGMLRRDSKKVKAGLNHRFERPTSNISLPLEDSIHSSMSSNSETRAFRVSALDMFSPRPKIRYSVGSQFYYGGAGPSPPSCLGKTETPPKERRTTFGKEDRRSSRIDELADTLDAGALRDIMERDKRRREKKRIADDERLRRRLERRAEKQRAAEQGGTLATPRKEARGVVGLGIEKETSLPMEHVRPSTPPPPSRLETNSQLPTPLESPVEEAVVSDAQAVRYSRGSVSSPVHTRGPSTVSHMPELLSETVAQGTPVESVEPAQDPGASGSLHPVETADTAAASKKRSGRRRSSAAKRLGYFASFFRRSKRNSQDPGRTTPSDISFSNNSRESMSRQPRPTHLVGLPTPTPPIQILRPSGVPHRTMSKFREDLPEFPLSPPDSRVQSPEVTSASAIASRRRSQPPSDLRVESNSPGPRTDSPVSPGVPATGVMSQSLASVDSEGSWLSGRPMQRRSNKSHIRSSVGSSTALKRNDDFNASYEELGIPDDEYFRRLTPQPDERRRSALSAELLARKPSSIAVVAIDAAAESDDDEPPPTAGTLPDEDSLVKINVGRQPTIVHRKDRVKSTEGLLSYFLPDKSLPEESAATADEAAEQESPASESEPVSVQRATSVDLGKHHVRHLSVGSAKLLDIKRSNSTSQPKLTE